MKTLQLTTLLLWMLSISDCSFVQRAKHAKGALVDRLGVRCGGPFHWDGLCSTTSSSTSHAQTSSKSSSTKTSTTSTKTSKTSVKTTSTTTSTTKTTSAKTSSTKSTSTQTSSTSCKTFSASTPLATSDLTNFNIYLDPITKPVCPGALYLTESATAVSSCQNAALQTLLDDRGQLLQRQNGEYHLFSTGVNSATMPLQASSSIMADYFYWRITNQALVWDNADFQGGTATFCLFANQTVWAYFKTTPPSDCSLVNLRVVPGSKCGK